MATVLVSFIGNGNLIGHEYMSVSYRFENEDEPRRTKIFGSVLLKHLIDNNKQIDSWLIMGTKESIWFDLIEIVENSDLTDEEKRLKDFLFKNTFNSLTNESGIEQKNITKWQGVLNSRLNDTKINCRLVGDATSKESQELIFNSLNEVIKEGDEIVFDVTHGMRNQPIITTFILMYLRYAKKININNICFYYASLDRDNKNGNVHKLDFCNELLKATEAVAIYEQTGNYVQLGKQLNLGNEFEEKLDDLNFADEMHRAKQDLPDELKTEISKSIIISNPIKESLSHKLCHSLSWSSYQSFAIRLKEKAIYYKDKEQYFKAIASLYEAIAVASCLVIKQKHNGTDLNVNEYKDRFYAVNDYTNGIKTQITEEEKDKLKNLKDLRNIILHGTESVNLDENQKALSAIKNKEEFMKIFDGGLEVLDSILAKI